ncbi:hypothetical protein M8J77_024208 [Diaphorina citri]|nr:hypothetical protein M8J77_024208 [Diaphorina citri]
MPCALHFIPIEIVEENCYEKNVSFIVELKDPKELNGKRNNNNNNRIRKNSSELSADEKVALQGKPHLTANSKIQITIRESDEFKNTVDKLVEKGPPDLGISTNSWSDQFADAFRVGAGKILQLSIPPWF